MTHTNIQSGQRILVIDDNRAIHEDFRKILALQSAGRDTLEAKEAALFGETTPPVSKRQVFQIDSAYQGQEGLRLLQEAVGSGQPYALAFVDVRGPAGGCLHGPFGLFLGRHGGQAGPLRPPGHPEKAF